MKKKVSSEFELQTIEALLRFVNLVWSNASLSPPITPCQILTWILSFLPNFSRKNWRVIFQVFQSNFNFAWLNSTGRILVWENEWNNWEMFTCSLCSHNFKSGNIYVKIWQCASLLTPYLLCHHPILQVLLCEWFQISDTNCCHDFMNADDLSLLYLKDNKQYIHTYTITTITQCLKITEIVSFYIASEMSYVYILNGQKFKFKNV